MSEARAIPDSIGPFIRALRRNGSPRVNGTVLPGDPLWSFVRPRATGSRPASRGDSRPASPDQTTELLALVTRQERTPADQLFRSSGLSLDDFANSLSHLQETDLVKLVETPAGQVVETTPLGRQLARAR